jgi:hypothetical protein
MRKSAADANASSLCEMLMYGLKGVCAYADHAQVHGKEDPRVFAFVHEALAFLASPDRNDLGKALKMVRTRTKLPSRERDVSALCEFQCSSSMLLHRYAANYAALRAVSNQCAQPASKRPSARKLADSALR